MKKYYVTFGQDHTHVVDDVLFDKDCVGVVYATDHATARDIMVANFKLKFCTSYDEDDFCLEEAMQYYPRGLIDVNEEYDNGL